MLFPRKYKLSVNTLRTSAQVIIVSKGINVCSKQQGFARLFCSNRCAFLTNAAVMFNVSKRGARLFPIIGLCSSLLVPIVKFRLKLCVCCRNITKSFLIVSNVTYCCYLNIVERIVYYYCFFGNDSRIVLLALFSDKTISHSLLSSIIFYLTFKLLSRVLQPTLILF